MPEKAGTQTLAPAAPDQVATAPTLPAPLADEVAHICQRIPPLWDLANYVAVNPFVGFAGEPLVVAAQYVRDGLGGQLLPGSDFYRTRWQAGAFGAADLEQAARRSGQQPEALQALLDGAAPVPTRLASAVLTFAERHDRRTGSDWQQTVVRYVALWCAAQVPGSENYWQAAPGGLYTVWRETAQADWTLEIAGLKGWRQWAAHLPTTPEDALATLTEQLELVPPDRAAYLYPLLGGIFGWASFLRRTTWAAGTREPGALLDLLAILLCADGAVAQLAPTTPTPPVAVPPTMPGPDVVEDEQVLAVLQEALEDGYARRLLGSIAAPPTAPVSERPVLQAAFCIDVRSEVLRRHLEGQHPAIQTIGFAGFFGVSLDWQARETGSARCPVLLQPTLTLQSLAPIPDKRKHVRKAVQQSPATFTYVELLGVVYGLRLVGDALNWLRAPHPDEGTVPFSLQPSIDGTGLALADRVALAASILKNIGLRARFARLVLLCGHGSTTENNAHAAGLDCGACGGHAGAINAHVAAVLLNDPDVRTGLVEQGWSIPADTYFVPGLHDTTLDAVTLFDTATIPPSHAEELRQAEHWLAEAGVGVRAERAPGLGLAGQPPGTLLDRLVQQRAHDWSEVRPEWGLARNVAFIAARRTRTRGVDLEGRTFLHDYDWTTDPDNSILTLILSAPMVVASWINLQYFASTVDNDRFGCGTKALQNRISTLGVVLGNGGDLRTGLALQSVHTPDGRWYHEPLRLQVVVEAPHERIDAVLRDNEGVRNLVEQGWVRLFALDPAGDGAAYRMPGGAWQAV